MTSKRWTELYEEALAEIQRESRSPPGSMYDRDDRDSAKMIASLKLLREERERKPPTCRARLSHTDHLRTVWKVWPAQMAESDALAMLAIKSRQVAERDRWRPHLVVDNKRVEIIAGPSVIDQDVARILKLPDGSGRIEYWRKGEGWTEAAPGMFTLDEFMPGACLPVSASVRARLGIPASEL
jgi:hypothetical protein